MNKSINLKLKKIILIFIIIISIFTTIFPSNIVIAADEVGGTMFKPIFQLFCGIADLGIKLLQNVFMGNGDIKNGGVEGVEEETYQIRYSPAIIFSNRVPGLDINFINPMDSVQLSTESKKTNEVDSWGDLSYVGQAELNEEVNKNKTEILNKYGYSSSNVTTVKTETLSDSFSKWTGQYKTDTVQKWEYEGKTYYLFEEYWTANVKGEYTITGDFYESNTGTQSVTRYSYNMSIATEESAGGTIGEERESSAKILQDTVATWYRVLRTVALVGLLSVLVYIGIRVIISSTGEDKAKYKKMINNWVVAVCLLFLLHYIMAGVLWITEEITSIFSVNIVDENGVDTLMSSIRAEVGDDNPQDFTTTFGSTVIYIALVVLTFIFTFQYLKRLLYMAFFTMIAPLIALTYPLDKIKDGQAQAFSTWIREYVFNALIQVIHIILYYMLIESAQSLVEENPLYAVVAIGFMVPAEKFFRKLFGFDKASTVGQLGAAAGGALVMNAINKMGQKAGKEAAAKETKPPKFFGSSPSDKVLGNPAPVGGNAGGGAGGANPVTGRGTNSAAVGRTNSATGGTNIATGTQGMWGSLGKPIPTKAKSIKDVARTTGTKLWAKKGEIAKKALKKGAGVALGATAGMVGLGVGVATGDLGNVAKYAGAGVAAGYLGGSGLAGSAIKTGENIKTSYRENFYGPEARAILDNTDELWKRNL